MVKKIILVIILLPILLWMMAPKKELFYLLEKRLAAQGVVLADGIIHEYPFGLTIEHPSLYYKGIKIATGREISLWSVLAYTHGTIDTVSIDPSLQSYLPKAIQKISIVHSIIDPNHIAIKVADPMLPAEGNMNISQRRIQIIFPKIGKKSAIKRYLKHTKGGWTYEQRF